MARSSPFHALHADAAASFMTWGAPGADEKAGAPIVESFGEIGLEYAAIRREGRGCAVFDQPHRGTIRVRGKDRIPFLNRKLTQELKDLAPFRSRRSFWLNRRGRIDADLRIIELPDEMYFDLDVLCAAATVATLSAFIFSEDIELADVSDSMHRIALHGPASLRLLQQASIFVDGTSVIDLSPGRACRITIADKAVIADRDDSTGDIGIELLMQSADARAVWDRLFAVAAEPSPAGPLRLKPIGWHAWNIARIEAGTPLFNIDFGPDSLPHETGVLESRVSFTKGCYLGQEVVARMHSLGHPKQRLVALRPPLDSATSHDPEWQPSTGSAVMARNAEGAEDAKPVGAVTSSTRSPMLGDSIICFAQVRYASTDPGMKLIVRAPAGDLPMTVQDTLAFWKRQ
ncbi:MAG TPA: hypothetical protein VG797_06625 [Phycisphaerales bacterium]|nr:hypothetical protein [Phycisphaerales bacterium]